MDRERGLNRQSGRGELGLTREMKNTPASATYAAAHLFGQRLKSHREAAGLTQVQLSEQIGVTPDYVSLIERGRANPTIDVMVKLAEAIHAEVSNMFAPP